MNKKNIITNMKIQSIFVKETLNDKEELVNDFMFNCGMSESEANFAAMNVLNEDLN